MIVNNVQVYGLEESIRGAKFPMAVDVNSIITPEELKYWLEDDFLFKFIQHQDNNKYPKYEICDDYVTMEIKANTGENVKILIDEEDLPLVFGEKWSFIEYCKSNKVGLLHRYILKEELKDNNNLVVDHINRNTLDNRKQNLRLATPSQNGFNSKKKKSNTSGIIGVTWKKDKNKWKAYIMVKFKQIHIGYYDNFEDAVKARLEKEYELCGEFATQRELFKEYGIKTCENKGIQKTYCRLKDAIAAYKNICRLSATQKGTGHDQALTGIIVQFDLTFSVKAWTEAQRYHFLDFVSSQSTMHRITKFDLDNSYMEYVDKRIVEIMKEKVKEYNELESKEDKTQEENEKLKEMYLKILYSNPCGFRLTARMTTNYRQLKTIYSQRKYHRLPEWREFCSWVETLPYAELIIGNKEEEK